MRILAVVAASVVLLLPAAAVADEFHGNQCQRTYKQIVRFQDTLELAEERGNDLWADATRQHIQRLKGKLERRCPEMVRQNILQQGAIETAKFFKAAAQAAVTYFTGGMGGLGGL